MLRDLGDRAAAKEHYEASLRIATTVYGPDHAALAPALVGLGKLQAPIDRLAAIKKVTRAVSILRASAAPERRIAIAQTTLAMMHIDAGDAEAKVGRMEAAASAWALARIEFTQAVALVDGAPNRQLVRAQSGLCHVAALLGTGGAGLKACAVALDTLAAYDKSGAKDEVDVLMDYARLLPATRQAARRELLAAAVAWYEREGHGGTDRHALATLLVTQSEAGPTSNAETRLPAAVQAALDRIVDSRASKPQ
ncbi:MAG: tetratricopeptide repeat protein [Nannocystaceae bacterium]|nr:tetratricopeptide repeat protein [Nannocystaceae bacterium]